MPRRYLFGPVTRSFADQNLHCQCQAGDCLIFNEAGDADVAIGPTDTWDAVCRRLPGGWQPDFIVLFLPYTCVPACLWSAPVPLIGLAPDWDLLWHDYRIRLRGCDLALTDAAGVDALARIGITHARPATLLSCPQDWVDKPWPDGPRDIDVLFAGNLDEAIHRERLPWLARLVALAGHRRVVLTTGVRADDYRVLLGRARIAFNHAAQGACNRRAFEAAAAGALLFQEAGNREVPAFFRDRRECVYYTPDDLELLLEHYLGHEAERRAIAEAARERVRQFTNADLWDGCLAALEREWPALTERAGRRSQLGPADDLFARTGQFLGSSTGSDPSLASHLADALTTRPHLAVLHNALGLVTAAEASRRGPLARSALEQVAGHFGRAWASDPGHVVAGLNLVETLALLGQVPQAVEQAHCVLTVLARRVRTDLRVLDAGHFPLGFDHFRVEWERAAWANAGQRAAEVRAKGDLLRWRLHTLLAELTGDLAHYYEAVLSRPDLPVTRAALGCALGRQGRPAEAVIHLQRAVAAHPFDLPAARALAQTLQDTGDVEGRCRFARDRQLLSQAAPALVPSEPWFVDAAPLADELVSIIVLCCDQLAYTRLCLASVLRHTRPPYELVLVDNGSSDGTPAYLEELKAQPGPARVAVIRNATNRGFPAGCNQALAQARGRFLVFLNNDTMVSAGWLDGLIGGLLRDWPAVGMVGAVSNYALPTQQVATDYQDWRGLAAFAAQRQREYAGRTTEVDQLSGFCLLARREVFDGVGGFDERFGLGFFDDNDLGLRARQAGFRLRVAQDVFVHHFGSRTFTGLGIDCHRQLQDNLALFQAKWGRERTAGYRIPEREPASPPLRLGSETVELPPLGGQPFLIKGDGSAPLLVTCPPPPRQTVSLCLIVKNEEANLPACLNAAADLVDEVIVVDTGSSDATKEVAGQLGARVFDFPWVDSFAAARNETLRHATGQWIFWLDADDRLDEANRGKLRQLFARLGDENAAYAMKCVCLPDPETLSATVVDHIRLFRNHPEIRWQYRVHEQILPSVRKAGGLVRQTDVAIHHVGYQDPALRKKKQQRDLRLLVLDQTDHPDEPFTLFNLGWAYEEMGRPAEALPLLRRSLERSHPGDSIVRKLYTLIMECHRQLGDRAAALAACQEGRRYYPDDAQLLFQEALLRREGGDLSGAEACLVRLLGTEEGPHFASVAEGLRSFKARHLLGVIYRDQGRWPEAEAQWRATLAERPDFTPARATLGELLAAQHRSAELEELGRYPTPRGRVAGPGLK